MVTDRNLFQFWVSMNVTRLQGWSTTGEGGIGGCHGGVPVHVGTDSLLHTRALRPEENASVHKRWDQEDGHLYSVHFIELCIKIQSLLLTTMSSSKNSLPNCLSASSLSLFLGSGNYCTRTLLPGRQVKRHRSNTPLLKTQFLSWVLNFATESQQVHATGTHSYTIGTEDWKGPPQPALRKRGRVRNSFQQPAHPASHAKSAVQWRKSVVLLCGSLWRSGPIIHHNLWGALASWGKRWRRKKMKLVFGGFNLLFLLFIFLWSILCMLSCIEMAS